MSLFALFNLNKDSRYDEYEKSCVEYNNSDFDMYGINLKDPKIEKNL